MKTIILTILITAGIHAGIAAQSAGEQKAIPITVSLLNERVSIPTVRYMFSNWNLGAIAGTEFYYLRKIHLQLFQTAEIGFYSHDQIGTAGMIYSGFGIRGMWQNLEADFRIGPGYVLNYSYSPLYRENSGGYAEASRLQSRLMLKSGMALGYRIKNITPFIAYSYAIETPFINSQSALLPHQFAEAGLRFYLLTGKQK